MSREELLLLVGKLQEALSEAQKQVEQGRLSCEARRLNQLGGWEDLERMGWGWEESAIFLGIGGLGSEDHHVLWGMVSAAGGWEDLGRMGRMGRMRRSAIVLISTRGFWKYVG